MSTILTAQFDSEEEDEDFVPEKTTSTANVGELHTNDASVKKRVADIWKEMKSST
jgi:hypothetical protein